MKNKIVGVCFVLVWLFLREGLAVVYFHPSDFFLVIRHLFPSTDVYKKDNRGSNIDPSF